VLATTQSTKVTSSLLAAEEGDVRWLLEARDPDAYAWVHQVRDDENSVYFGGLIGNGPEWTELEGMTTDLATLERFAATLTALVAAARRDHPELS
jgi:hypothetical protein